MQTQTLHPQQAQAVEFLDDWLAKPELKEASLKGYAGTGKTWLVGYWLGEVLKRNPKLRIIVMAPTNKALDVLRSKCAHLNVSFMTIDSFLGNRIKKNDDGETEKHRGKAKDNPDLICCDEASMVKEEYHKDLKNRRVKTLYVGDPAQLPPINEVISSTFLVPHSFQMTEVVRYDGAIIKCATFLRERIESGAMFLLDDLKQFKEPGKGDLSFIARHSLHDWALTAVKKGLDSRIVAFTNADVNAHNARMHEMLYPGTPLYGEGERVVVNETFELTGEGSTADRWGEEEKAEDPEMLFNGEMLTVVSCEQAPSVAGVEIFNVAVRRDASSVAPALEVTTDDETEIVPSRVDYTLQVARDEQHMLQVHKELTNEIWALRRQGGNNEKRIAELLALRRPLNKLAPLRHSYACTVHKSQGSTYDVTFCDWSSIYQSRDRARMMYVANTRPSKFLVIAYK